MIDENKTFELFGYTSDTLSSGSDKKVWRICDVCKIERAIRYRNCTNLCLKCSHKTDDFKKKQSKNSSGKNNAMYNKHHNEESKRKISYAKKGKYCGKDNAMFGKHHSEETKHKQSKAVSGNKHPQWKGGKKLKFARRNAKRRQLFGFIPHNIPHKNFHGHHIDFNHVIFIPKELHISISHSVINNKNMDIINDAVCDWYLKDQIMI